MIADSGLLAAPGRFCWSPGQDWVARRPRPERVRAGEFDQAPDLKLAIDFVGGLASELSKSPTAARRSGLGSRRPSRLPPRSRTLPSRPAMGRAADADE